MEQALGGDQQPNAGVGGQQQQQPIFPGGQPPPPPPLQQQQQQQQGAPAQAAVGAGPQGQPQMAAMMLEMQNHMMQMHEQMQQQAAAHQAEMAHVMAQIHNQQGHGHGGAAHAHGPAAMQAVEREQLKAKLKKWERDMGWLRLTVLRIWVPPAYDTDMTQADSVIKADELMVGSATMRAVDVQMTPEASCNITLQGERAQPYQLQGQATEHCSSGNSGNNAGAEAELP